MAMSVGAVPAPSYWAAKRVFVTGHTGFKGSWLCEWLLSLGATVRGFALAPQTRPSLFDVISLHERIDHVVGDVRDTKSLTSALTSFNPHVVFHLAAQPLVRRSYREPLLTYETNVMGTANILDACRQLSSLRAVVSVTTDKCYENREWVWGYRETDALGGPDPYSASKAGAELVTTSYWKSFFRERGVGVASARAGNVLGGGDWSEDRLVPDAVRAFAASVTVDVRNPKSVRPWQHVVDPLTGYLLLAERADANPELFSGPWNFGPDADSIVSVGDVVSTLAALWGKGAHWRDTSAGAVGPHEATLLSLDVSKARARLDWRPTMDLSRCLAATTTWYRAYYDKRPRGELISMMSAAFGRPIGASEHA